MTVRELIEKLQSVDPSLEVCVGYETIHTYAETAYVRDWDYDGQPCLPFFVVDEDRPYPLGPNPTHAGGENG